MASPAENGGKAGEQITLHEALRVQSCPSAPNNADVAMHQKTPHFSTLTRHTRAMPSHSLWAMR
jgi:hypothetical protein